MMKSKKGQGLSLNVIIVAALALIVLVVLVMVFTGRIAVFDQGLSDQGKAELVAMKIQYGDCHPTATQEATFDAELSGASGVEAEATAKGAFKQVISDCRAQTEEGACESAGCSWK